MCRRVEERYACHRSRESLVYSDIPAPEPKAGHAVIQIEAFGINHAAMYMRRGEWAEGAPVSGIEWKPRGPS